MPKDISFPSNSSIENYFKIALSFSAPKLGLFLVRHPLHVIQTNKQAFQALTNIEIITNIYKKNGIKGFYKSTHASILKILVAESYRGILMIKVPKTIKSYIPKPWIDSHPTATTLTTSLIAALVISMIDASIICPFIRIVTLQLTTDKNLTAKKTYETYIRGNTLRNLYRGYTPLLIQTSFLWANFFIIDDFNKSILNKHFNKISYPELALASIVGGSAQTLLNVIPDTIRVQMQNTTSHHLSMRDTVKKMVKQYGIRSLFSAVPHKLAAGIVTYGYKSILRHFWTNNENS